MPWSIYGTCLKNANAACRLDTDCVNNLNCTRLGFCGCDSVHFFFKINSIEPYRIINHVIFLIARLHFKYGNKCVRER